MSSDNEPILLSVGVPAYQSKDVSWLSLLGLSKQKGVPVPWEVVICQEDDSIDEALLEEMREPLQSAGCRRIEVVKLDEWIPLSLKWIQIRDSLSDTSEVFLLQGVDDFPHPDRLASSWEALKNDADCDWFHWKNMLFFDFNFETWSEFRGGEKPPLPVPRKGWTHHPCCPNMATRTRYLDFLKEEEVKRGVDGWIFYSIQDGLKRKPVIREGEDREQRLGFGTTGFNHLSVSRIKMGRSPQPPIFPCDYSLEEVLEPEVAKRVYEMCDQSRKKTLNLLLDELEVSESKLNSLRAFVSKYGWIRKAMRPAFFLLRAARSIFGRGGKKSTRLR